MQDIDLSAFAFFQGMKREHLDLLANHASVESYRSNSYIFKEKDEASNLFLVLKGTVSVEMASPEGKLFSIQTLKAGDILGWSWMIPPYQWRFSARAVHNTELVMIDGVFVREKTKQDHDLGYEILERLAGVFAKRLEATRRQLMETYNSV